MQVIAILAPHRIHNVALFIAGLLLMSVFCFSCSDLEQQTERVNEALSDSLTSTTETWDLNLRLIEEGTKKVRLQGSYAASYSDDKTKETRIRGPVYIEVFDSTATVKTWVESDSAIYRPEVSEFEFFGDVRVRTRDKRHLESEYLKWDQTNNKISTPQFVIITTPSDSLSGTGFRGTTDLNRYTILKPTGQVEFDH